MSSSNVNRINDLRPIQRTITNSKQLFSSNNIPQDYFKIYMMVTPNQPIKFSN